MKLTVFPMHSRLPVAGQGFIHIATYAGHVNLGSTEDRARRP